MLKLVIGNYNYSSWSLRAWLHLRASAIPFTVERIVLFSDEWRREIGRYTPTRRQSRKRSTSSMNCDRSRTHR